MIPTKEQQRLFEELNEKFGRLPPQNEVVDVDWKQFEELRIPYIPPKRVFVKDSKFKLFDTVRHKKYGLGTVIGSHRDTLIEVDFDEYNPKLHSLCGKCQEGHGWACYPTELEKVE